MKKDFKLVGFSPKIPIDGNSVIIDGDRAELKFYQGVKKDEMILVAHLSLPKDGLKTLRYAINKALEPAPKS